jgi:hypothetical protein
MGGRDSLPIKLAFALICGLCLVAISLFRTHLDLTGSVVVRPKPLSPLWIRLTPALLICATAAGYGMYAAARALKTTPAAATRVGLIWAAAAVTLVLASRFFPIYPESGYAITTSYQLETGGTRTLVRTLNGWLINTVVLFPVVGAIAGVLTAMSMRRPTAGVDGKGRQLGAAAAWWALALCAGGVVGFYALYFVVAMTIDSFEALGWPARAGQLLGRLLAGGLAGWVIGAIGGRSLRPMKMQSAQEYSVV